MDQGNPTRRRRRQSTPRTARTVRTVRVVCTARRDRTTTRRRSAGSPPRSSAALQMYDSLVEISRPGRGGSFIIIKASLAALGIVLGLSLLALGTLYLVYRTPSPVQAPAEHQAEDDAEKEFHVINGKVLIMKKARREPDAP